ncbi:MAG: hypothetical protein MJK04_16265 [Psychrosphaera sp.]|nr:hypothetical protein [Psychrosphaera sp.]
MDVDFEQHEARRVSDLRAQNRKDLDAEMAGLDNGRVARFGLETKLQKIERKKRENQVFDRAAKISAAYIKLYDTAFQNLNDVRTAIYEAQLSASMALGQAQKALKALKESASKTPDGVAVFLSKDGKLYDENGQKLVDDVLMSVLIQREGAPSWADYQDGLDNVGHKQLRLNRINGFDMRLDELEKELGAIKDHDTPENSERMEAINQEFIDIINDVKPDQAAAASFSVQKANAVILPDLKL